MVDTELNYEWYDTQSYYDANSHPTSRSALDNFFDDTNSGVSFGGSGTWSRDAIDWGSSSQSGAGGTADTKHSYLPADGFSWRVHGYIEAPETGTYTIGVDGDDACDVIIDGTLTANFYDGHGFEDSWTSGTGQNTGIIDLTSGNLYTFEARMEEGGGGDGIQVGWQKPSDSSISLISSSVFDSTGTPAAPSELTIDEENGPSIDMSWTDNSGNEDNFNIYESSTSGSSASDYTLIDTVTADTTSYSHTGLSRGTTHYYRVSAENNGGESSLSNEVSGTTTSATDATSLVWETQTDWDNAQSESNIQHNSSDLELQYGTGFEQDDLSNWSVIDGSISKVNSPVINGSFSLKHTNGSGGVDAYLDREINSSTGWIEWKARTPSVNIARMEINELGINGDIKQIGAITFEADGNFGSSDGDYWTETGPSYNVDTWYTFRIEWNDSSSSYDVYVWNADKTNLIWNPPNSFSYNNSSAVTNGVTYSNHRIDDTVYVDSITTSEDINRYITESPSLTTSKKIL